MKKLKLMVIDDNREFCRLVRDYSKSREEIEFCGATFDGISAMGLIRELNPDIIILDTVMPQLDGIGVMKHIRNSETNPKVIAVSVSPTDFVVAEMCRLGADYIISKNTDIADIIERCLMLFDQNTVTESTENIITSAICAIGIPANLKGYSLLRTSINMAMTTPDIIYSVTTTLYPAIAKRYNTTPSNVERNIRNAIDIAWSRGDKKILSQIFGTSLVFTNSRPTNSEFIAMLADKLRTKTGEHKLPCVKNHK